MDAAAAFDPLRSPVATVPAAPEALHRDARPPIATEAAPPSGAAGPYRILRPTAAMRPLVAPGIWDDPRTVLGYPLDHPYVRRFWTAVMGPGAVTDLLRLATAARRGSSVPLPIHLPVLVTENLARTDYGRIRVRTSAPPLSMRHVRRLPPFLRREHEAVRWAAPHRPQCEE